MSGDAGEMFAHAQYAAEDEHRAGLEGPTEEPPPEYEYRLLYESGKPVPGGPYPTLEVAEAKRIVHEYDYRYASRQGLGIQRRAKRDNEWEAFE